VGAYICALKIALSSDLYGWAEKKQKEQQEADFLRGQADFITRNQQGYEEAVRTGAIPASASPYYVRGYKQASGSAAGFGLESIIAAKYEEWPDSNNTDDPQAYEKWFADTIKGAVPNNDPYYLKGLLPHIQELHNRFHDRWEAQREKNTTYQAQASFSALTAGAIDNEMLDWQQDGQDGEIRAPDVENMRAKLDVIRERGLSMGMKREDVDKAQIDAIQAKSLQYRNPSILNLLDSKGAGGESLGQTPYGSDVKQKTEGALMAVWHKETEEDRKRQQQADKQASDSATRTILDTIAKNPSAPIDENLMATLSKTDPTARLTVMGYRDKLIANEATDDPRKVNMLYQDILSGGDGTAKLLTAMKAGDIQSKEAISGALGFIKSVEEYNKGGAKILQTAAAKQYIGQLNTLGLDPELSQNRMFGEDAALTANGRQALNNYRVGLMRWAVQNPNASPLDAEDYAAKFGERIVQSMGAPNFSKERIYTPPQETRDFPSISPTQPQQPPQPPRGQPQVSGPRASGAIAAPVPADPNRATAPAANPLSAFSPDDQVKIQNRAQQLGVPVENVIRLLNDRGIRGSSPAAPSAPGPRSDIAPATPGGFNVGWSPDAVRQVAANLGVTPDAVSNAVRMVNGLTRNASLTPTLPMASGATDAPSPAQSAVAQSPSSPATPQANAPSEAVAAQDALSPTRFPSVTVAPVIGAQQGNALRAMGYLEDRWGMSREDAAALVLNFQQESGKDMNTTMSHDGGTGFGIAGFRDPTPGHGRKTDLMSFAQAQGKDPRDLYTQLDFVVHELQGPERRAWNAIQAATTPEAKHQAALSYFRPAERYAAYRRQESYQVNDLIAGRDGYAPGKLRGQQQGGQSTTASAASPASNSNNAQSNTSDKATDTSWLTYDNQDAIRSQPISNRLQQALGSFLPQMGVTMRVFSGGQDAEGPNRTGSHRHDHGEAADVFFYKDGRKLDWANTEDRKVFQEIVSRGRQAGITGFGAGDGYMRPGSMHIGYGKPGVWGAGGHTANAPGWLREAFNRDS